MYGTLFKFWISARRGGACAIVALMALASAGCHIAPNKANETPLQIVPPQSNVPRELAKTTLPRYTIEPPDILTIDAIQLIPKAPYHLRTLDVIMVEVTEALPDSPINGPYTVEPGGGIQLGVPYGSVNVAGLTVDDAAKAIHEQLTRVLKEPEVTVRLGQVSATQQISGQHLVTPDGTVTLGTYGSVNVTGKTLAEAKAAIEQHLSAFLESPEVGVTVFAYNSKVYYVVTQGAGLGDGVARFPMTGNETVLDAISQINGLQSVSSKRIWIARPTPGCEDRVIPVDWCAVTGRGSSATNYQIMPGDRIFVEEDKLVALDNGLGKLISPFERIFGFTLLGTNTVQRIKFFNQGNQFNNNVGP
jgi:polysaccharide biosynthesis/export protein